jgi:hypothetical protein
VFYSNRSKFEKVNEWGIRTTNGSWNGMIKKLMNDEADAAVADFHMSVERMKVIDYLLTLQKTS